jgi:hypothetical protein
MAALGTGNISLQDIIDHITDPGNAGPDVLAQESLDEAFTEARANASDGFNATYNVAGSERLSEFRGFDYQGGGGSGTSSITVITNITGEVAFDGATLFGAFGVTLSDSQTGTWTVASSETWCTLSYGGTNNASQVQGTGEVSTGVGGILANFASNSQNPDTRTVTISATLSGSTGSSITITQAADPGGSN